MRPWHGRKTLALGNYAIENLIGVEQPFTVRVIVKGCDRIGVP